MDRKEKVITDEGDKTREESTIKEALKICGYPEWAFKASETKTKSQNQNKMQTETKSRGMAVLPYKEGLSQRIRRVFNKHGIRTAFKPHQTLRNILVHPKDKRELKQTPDCVYEIPCLNCDKSYIGETSRLFGTRLKEHQTEAEKASKKAYTRAQRKTSIAGEVNKSAITDHVSEANHVIGWEDAKICDREKNRNRRHIKEAIWIRKRGAKTLNRDEGNYFLPHIYDQLLKPTAPPTTSSKKKQSAGFGHSI